MIFLLICLAYCVLWIIWWFIVPMTKLIFFVAKYDMTSIGSMRNRGNFCYIMKYQGKEIKVMTDFTTDQIEKFKYALYDFYDFVRYSVKKSIKRAESDPTMLVTSIYYNHYLREGKGTL